MRSRASLDARRDAGKFACIMTDTFGPLRRIPRTLIRFAVLAASLASAAPAAATTLTEALAITYRTNPDLKAARRELGATNEAVPQALSGWRPEVSISGSVGKQVLESQSQGFTGDATTTPVQGRFEVRQPLYRGGRNNANTERAVSQVGAQRARLMRTEQDVLLRTVRAYMNVWRDQAILRLNRNNVERLRRQLQATQDRFDVGEVTRTDVSQAKSRLQRAIADRVEAQGALESSRAVYEEVVGRPPAQLEQPKPPGNLPESVNAAVRTALDQNPQTRAARFAEIAARRNVRAITGELLPDAELVARASRSANSTSAESSSETLEVLAQISIPLYQRGAVFSRMREAKQTANQRRLELRGRKRQVEQEAVSAWEDLQAARARIDAIEAQVRSAEIALDGVRQESQVGARTVLDVLDAEQELLNAEVDLIRAQRDEIVAAYALLAALGRLTAEDRGLPVQVFDVDKAFQDVRNKLWGSGLPEVYDDE
jgi:TolC family type I secretion outer membrane protein